MRELPERLLIIGAGWVSLEFTKMYQQLGSHVEILLRGNKLVTIDAHEGSIAMTNILFGNKKMVNEKAIPHAMFTTPEIGSNT